MRWFACADRSSLLRSFAVALDRSLSRLEAATDLLASIPMFAIMALVGAEVVARYFFRSPIAWAHDVLTMYLIPAMFFFGLPGAYRRNAHVAVDFVVRRLGRRARRVASMLGNVAGFVLFACILWFSAEHAIDSYRSAEIVPGVAAFPVWPSFAMVTLGCALILLRLLEEVIGDAAGGRAKASAEAPQRFITELSSE